MTVPTGDESTTQDDADMRRYGITRTTVDQFGFGDYRYSSLKDAVAQAKRHSIVDEGGS